MAGGKVVLDLVRSGGLAVELEDQYGVGRAADPGQGDDGQGGGEEVASHRTGTPFRGAIQNQNCHRPADPRPGAFGRADR